MEGEKNEHFEMKMRMWKMKDEMLNAMSDKELRAFIKGYMMAEKMVFRQLQKMNESECGCGVDSCGGESGGCGEKECNCGKE